MSITQKLIREAEQCEARAAKLRAIVAELDSVMKNGDEPAERRVVVTRAPNSPRNEIAKAARRVFADNTDSEILKPKVLLRGVRKAGLVVYNARSLGQILKNYPDDFTHVMCKRKKPFWSLKK